MIITRFVSNEFTVSSVLANTFQRYCSLLESSSFPDSAELIHKTLSLLGHSYISLPETYVCRSCNQKLKVANIILSPLCVNCGEDINTNICSYSLATLQVEDSPSVVQCPLCSSIVLLTVVESIMIDSRETMENLSCAYCGLGLVP